MRFRPAFRVSLALLLLGALFSGCANAIKRPLLAVSLVDVRIVQATAFETSVAVTVRLQNENTVPLALSGSTHRIFLNGNFIGRGVSSEAVGVPALSTTTQQITLFLENTALAGRLRQILGSRSADYRLESEYFLEQGDEKLKLSARGEGRLDLGALQ